MKSLALRPHRNFAPIFFRYDECSARLWDGCDAVGRRWSRLNTARIEISSPKEGVSAPPRRHRGCERVNCGVWCRTSGGGGGGGGRCYKRQQQHGGAMKTPAGLAPFGDRRRSIPLTADPEACPSPPVRVCNRVLRALPLWPRQGTRDSVFLRCPARFSEIISAPSGSNQRSWSRSARECVWGCGRWKGR